MKISKHLLFLITLFAAMLVFFVYTQLFSTFNQREFIAIYNVDKFFHCIGGIFIVSALQYIWPSRKIGWIVAMLLVGTIVWELFEWVALPDVRDSFANQYIKWKVDTVQDIIVGFVAGSIYLLTPSMWQKSREKKPEPTMKPIGGTNAFIEAQKRQKEIGKEQILELLEKRQKIQNNDVEQLLGVSDATATRYLQELEDEGKITQEGGTKSAYYTIK